MTLDPALVSVTVCGADGSFESVKITEGFMDESKLLKGLEDLSDEGNRWGVGWRGPEGVMPKGILETWVAPEDCDPPHAVKHLDKFEELTHRFLMEEGWDLNEPALIGYPFEGRIQLLVDPIGGPPLRLRGS